MEEDTDVREVPNTGQMTWKRVEVPPEVGGQAVNALGMEEGGESRKLRDYLAAFLGLFAID
ncbi:hypothetical protein BDZ97DRAFT_1926456 [Flammula alnicola]|nr:hypothetical protein BDZ97DRAFT_1926456 [Flammula alnicola]